MANIRLVSVDDAPAIAEIYNHYVENTVVSFECDIVSVDEIIARIRATQKGYPWLVCEASENDEPILGFAYANAFKGRIAYQHTVETTVYISPDHIKQGAGTLLYKELFCHPLLKNSHTAIASIALPNTPSVGLHEKFGFTKRGVLQEVGYKMNRWVDVGYWQKNLSAVGIKSGNY